MKIVGLNCYSNAPKQSKIACGLKNVSSENNHFGHFDWWCVVPIFLIFRTDAWNRISWQGGLEILLQDLVLDGTVNTWISWDVVICLLPCLMMLLFLFSSLLKKVCGYWFSMSVERNEIHPNVNSDSAGRDVLIVHPFFMFLTCSLSSFDRSQRLWDPSIPNWLW